MSYTVEKDIPAPEIRGRYAKYPFSEMDVGDSFGFDCREARRVRNAAFQHGRRHDQQFTVRKNGDGCRCWRVK